MLRSVTREKLDPAIRNRLRAYVRDLLKRRDLTQTELADKLGVRQSTISGILSGRREMGLYVFVRLREVYHLDPAIMLDEDPRPGVQVEADTPIPKVEAASLGGSRLAATKRR